MPHNRQPPSPNRREETAAGLLLLWMLSLAAILAFQWFIN